MVEVKEPDCVRMKREIQEKLADEFKGMSNEEIRREHRRRIEEHPLFGTLSKQWITVNSESEKTQT
jgi:hypothetical protein